VTGLFLSLVEFISGFKLNEGIAYLVIASSILAWYFIILVRRGIIQEFKLEENKLSIKKLTGQILTLHKDEIQRVEWKKNTFIFHRVGQPFIVNSLNWAMTTVLFYWIPEKLLPSEVQGFIKEAKDLAKNPSPVLEEPLQVYAKLRCLIIEPELLFTFIFFLGFIVLLVLIVSFNTVGLLIILLAILCCGLFVWSILSRSFELNNEGIGYKTLSGARAFHWNEIEVVEVKTRGKELKIWVRGRFTRVKLTTLALEDQTLLRESFLTQIYTRGIPVCYSETRF
jgi:hypothetical protein